MVRSCRIQTAVLSCSQIVFNWWFNMFFFELLVVAKWFWCRPRFYWRNPRSRSVEHGRVTEWRSRQVFPICCPCLWVSMILILMLVLGLLKPKRWDARCCTDWSTCRDASWWALMSTRYSSERFWSVEWKFRNVSSVVIFPVWLALHNFSAEEPTAVWVSLCFTQYFDYCSSRCCFVVLLLKLFRMPP